MKANDLALKSKNDLARQLKITSHELDVVKKQYEELLEQVSTKNKELIFSIFPDNQINQYMNNQKIDVIRGIRRSIIFIQKNLHELDNFGYYEMKDMPTITKQICDILEKISIMLLGSVSKNDLAEALR